MKFRIETSSRYIATQGLGNGTHSLITQQNPQPRFAQATSDTYPTGTATLLFTHP